MTTPNVLVGLLAPLEALWRLNAICFTKCQSSNRRRPMCSMNSARVFEFC